MDCREFDKIFYLFIAIILCLYIHYMKYIFKIKCCLNNREVKAISSNENLV